MKYNLYGMMHVGVFIEVEANSLEEAIAIAEVADVPRICHQCSRHNGRGWGLSDGLGDLVHDVGSDDAETPE